MENTIGSTESFGSVLKQKMREIYEHHQKVSQGVENQLSALQQENAKLQKLNDKLQNEVEMLQERLGVLQNDNNRLNGELVNTTTRLAAPCENCRSMMFQIEQQNKLVYQLMEKHDLSITSMLDKYLQVKDARQTPSGSSGSESIPSVLHTLSQALQNSHQSGKVPSQSQKSLNTASEEHSKKAKLLKKKESSLKTENSQSQKQSKDMKDNRQTGRKQSTVNQGFVSNKASQKRVSEETENEIHGTCTDILSEIDVDESEKVSPTNAKLKLNRIGKRTRHKYIEESIPNTKRKKTSSSHSVSKQQEIIQTSASVSPSEVEQEKVISPPVVLAPDTCSVTIMKSPISRRIMRGNKRHGIMNRGGINVVPETVPMEGPLLSDDDSNSDNEVQPETAIHRNIKSPMYGHLDKEEKRLELKSAAVSQLLANVLMSPPSHASTPLPVSPETIIQVPTHSGSFVSENDKISPSSSPVFGKPTSPSLFDESENNSKCIHENDSDKCRSDKVRQTAYNDSLRTTKESVEVNGTKDKTKHSTSGDHSSLTADESSLLLSKPSSTDIGDKWSQKSNKDEHKACASKSPKGKGSQKSRMSPLDFSFNGTSKVNVMSPAGKESYSSPSVLSGKIKNITSAPKGKQSKRTGNKPGNLVLDKGKLTKQHGKLFQTKLTPETFKNKYPTRQTRLQEYNGKSTMENVDSLTQQEEEMIQQAKQASLHTEKLSPKEEDMDQIFRSDMVTSTPAVKRNSQMQVQIPDVSVIARHTDSVTAFKKPNAIPFNSPKRKKSHTKPMSPHRIPRENQHVDSLRRSPRTKIKTMDTKRTEKYEQSGRDEFCKGVKHKEEKILSHLDLNGTVDPHIDLAEFDSPGGVRSQYLESISMLDIDRAQNAVNTQQYLLSLENAAKCVTRAKLGSIESSQRSNQQSLSSNKSSPKSQRHTRASQRLLKSQKSEEQFVDMSEEKSAVFGTVSLQPCHQIEKTSDSCQDVFSSQAFTNNQPTQNSDAHNVPLPDDSFDRIPEVKDDKGYKYVKVVRKQAERAKLDTYVCIECDKWFNGMGLTLEEKKQRMKAGCKHKAMFAPPDTPEHYWSIGFPDTQQCKERGYMNITQAKPSKYRRQRPLRQLFTSDTPTDDTEEREISDISD